jgi:endonuclease YncB( thermonuclease family)
VLTAEGRLEFKTEKVKQVAEMIEKAQRKARLGHLGIWMSYTMRYNPRSILDAHVAMEIVLGSMR